MDIVIVTSAKTNEEAKALLTQMGMPFKKVGGAFKMAKKSMINKQTASSKNLKVREYTRCERCGRPHSVLRKYKLCRICFRELAYKGQIPGVKKG